MEGFHEVHGIDAGAGVMREPVQFGTRPGYP